MKPFARALTVRHAIRSVKSSVRISPEQVCVALLHFAGEAGVVQAEEMLAALKRRG